MTVTHLSRFFLILGGLIFAAPAHSQLKVDTFQTPDHLVRNVLLGGGVNVDNVTFKGAPIALGIFVNDSTPLPFRKGILISTGSVFKAIGPNNTPASSQVNRMPGDPILEAMARNQTFDAALLSFDFTPDQPELSFRFVFASEEYTEYVGKAFNDVFGFFVTGPGITGTKNIAMIPGTRTPVAVNNINESKHDSLYIDNNFWTKENRLIPGKRDSMFNPAQRYGLGFDGFTTILTARATLEAGKTYRMTIAIADVGDYGWDSGVFLEAGSFVSGQLNTNPIGEADLEIEPVLSPSSFSLPEIYFDHDSDEITQESLEALEPLIQHLLKNKGLQIEIHGHTDSDGSNSHNLLLSQRRAKSARDILIGKGIPKERIHLKHHGENAPISDNYSVFGKAKNRRASFKIRN